MKRFYLVAITAVLAMAACNTQTKKKVLVMGKGTLTARENAITYKQGSGYAETTVDIKDDKETTLTVDASGEKKEITIPAGEGFFILNFRVDTVVGAKQNIGTDLSSGRTMTQEELRMKIDSLILLTAGSNVKQGGTNFLLAPGSVTKISGNKNARVYGPFTKIPGKLDADPDGKEIELFKFYTNTEMRELIETLKEQTY